MVRSQMWFHYARTMIFWSRSYLCIYFPWNPLDFGDANSSKALVNKGTLYPLKLWIPWIFWCPWNIGSRILRKLGSIGLWTFICFGDILRICLYMSWTLWLFVPCLTWIVKQHCFYFNWTDFWVTFVILEFRGQSITSLSPLHLTSYPFRLWGVWCIWFFGPWGF